MVISNVASSAHRAPGVSAAPAPAAPRSTSASTAHPTPHRVRPFTRTGRVHGLTRHGRGRDPRHRPGATPFGPAGPHGAPHRRLRRLAQEQRLRVSAKSRLGRKRASIHRHWHGLQTFLDDGHVEIESTGVENLTCPVALNRRNARSAGHDARGEIWCRIPSLIETAKVNGLEPFAGLKATLEAIAGGHPKNGIEDLLPHNFTTSR